jgi:hypothetical protein
VKYDFPLSARKQTEFKENPADKDFGSRYFQKVLVEI